MTTYAISDTSNSFIRMAQAIGIAGSPPKDTGIKETLIVGNQAITNSLGNPDPTISHLSVFGNAKITGKIRCGGFDMVDDDTNNTFLDVFGPLLSDIYGNVTSFNNIIKDPALTKQTIDNFLKNTDPNSGAPYAFLYNEIALSNGNNKPLVPGDNTTIISPQPGNTGLPLFAISNTTTGSFTNITTDILAFVSNNYGSYRQVFNQRVDIAAQGQIFANAGYIIPSDKRIKEDIKTYDQLIALKQINDLRVTTYKKIDDPLRKLEVGFISQEVKEIIPESVEKMKMYIPDIHKWVPCTYDDETQTVTIENAFDLTFMCRLQVCDENGKKYPGVVTDIEDGKAVIHSTLFESEKPDISKRVFLYGKLVNDFLTLDKNVIFSVAVSSIQALSKQVNDLTARLERLENCQKIEEPPQPKQRAKRVTKPKK